MLAIRSRIKSVVVNILILALLLVAMTIIIRSYETILPDGLQRILDVLTYF